MTLGEQIKKRRLEKGLSMQKLSELIMIKGGRNTIYKYETDKIWPSKEILENIAHVLDCDLKIELQSKKRK